MSDNIDDKLYLIEYKETDDFSWRELKDIVKSRLNYVME